MRAPIFTSAGGIPLPLLPYDQAGVERVPDGAHVLSLEQAVGRWGYSEENLRTLWSSMWDEQTGPHAAAAASTPTDAVLAEAAAYTALHQSEFSELKPAQFAQYIYPVTRYDRRRGARLQFVYKINTLRTLAQRAGGFCGYVGTKIEYGENEREPFKATVTVVRKIEGERSEFIGTAVFSEYYPGPGTFWDEKPCLKLEYCAEALALRKAFPESLADLYLSEEMSAADRASAAEEQAKKTKKADPASWDARRKRPWPATLFDLNVALGELQIPMARRAAVIAQLRREIGEDVPDDAFFPRALQAVYRDPDDYGARVFEVEVG
jgi:hypothetical protein